LGVKSQTLGVKSLNLHPGEEQQQIVNIDFAGVDLWMRNWCNQHPVKLAFDGGVAFIAEMRTNAAASRR
jgi:hypothetical protein